MFAVRRLPTMGGLGRNFQHKLPDIEILRNLESPFILWIQTDIHFLASTSYKPENRHVRQETWSEEAPDGRWRAYLREELLRRDKASLDVFWLKDAFMTDLDNLRVLAEGRFHDRNWKCSRMKSWRTFAQCSPASKRSVKVLALSIDMAEGGNWGPRDGASLNHGERFLYIGDVFEDVRTGLRSRIRDLLILRPRQ